MGAVARGLTDEDLVAVFPKRQPVLAHEIRRETVSGEFRKGLASVIQLFGKKIFRPGTSSRLSTRIWRRKKLVDFVLPLFGGPCLS
jgi:hypothetical protein